jgi:hypothetical protein
MKVDFFYNMGEHVKIEALLCKGIIDAMMLSPAGKEYRIIYWMEGCRRVEWLREDELLKLGGRDANR